MSGSFLTLAHARSILAPPARGYPASLLTVTRVVIDVFAIETRPMKNVVTFCLLALCALCLCACETVSDIVGGLDELHIETKAPLNPNEDDESTPVDVRIYQLRDEHAFNRATFEDIWTDPSGALGGSVIGEARTLTLSVDEGPNIRIEPIEPDDDANFIGIFALFSGKADGPDHRKVCVSLDEAEDIVFVVSGYGIEKRPKE